MKCLYCGKPILNIHDNEDINWHDGCIKKFFGTSKLPFIELNESKLLEVAKESISKKITIPGVQKKISLYLTSGHAPRLTLVNYPTGYILKPQTEEYSFLPEAEYLVMQMARKTGIRTVSNALMCINRQKKEFAYITKRIDRIRNIDGSTNLLAMEDFCQLENRLSSDKYKGSYERCAKVIGRYSIQKGLDLTELFLRIVFSFVVGNSDMHLKNFSLIETKYGSNEYHLSDAYDMLPVNMIIPSDTEQLALTLNGKKKNIRKKDFFIFATTCNLLQKQAENLISKVVSMEETYISMCKESYLPQEMKEDLIQLIKERVEILKQ